MIVVGEYNRHGYLIRDAQTGKYLYSGGNSPWDSTTVLDSWDRYALSLHRLRAGCIRTAREIAEECGAVFGGVERTEEEF